jgi:ATP-dependent Clp protease ATP-binding subunit ClpX
VPNHPSSLGFSNKVQSKYEEADASGVVKDRMFALVEPADLVEYGFIPEFIGRFNTVCATKFLTEDDLVQILGKRHAACFCWGDVFSLF